MFAKAARIASTQALAIMSMERREELASMPLTLNGQPAQLVGLEDAKATIMDPQSGLCSPWAWDSHLEHMIEAGGRAITFSGPHTTSYFI